jgi:hypothetical protein
VRHARCYRPHLDDNVLAGFRILGFVAFLVGLLLGVLVGCGPVPPEQPEEDRPCGAYADPYADTFAPGCAPGSYARHDAPDGTVDVWRCVDGSWEPAGGRCRWYGPDLWCGCGL